MVQQTLEETKKLVWPVIKRYLKDPTYPKQFAIVDKFKKEIDLYWKINLDYPTRKSKYLRPTLLRLIASSLRVNTQLVFQAGAAMQISEEWILIHDDIEDNSDERRGLPTLHKIYGNELAINAGDSLMTIMWKVIVDTKNQELIDEFYKILMRTTLGQGIEIIGKNDRQISDDKYFFYADSKSGYYSMAGPMRLGAIVAKANTKQLEKITYFGLHLGRCFQLVDDVLDYEQDKKEGKITLANIKGVDYVKKLAQKEKEFAQEIFDNDLKFLSKEPARSELKELIDFILNRDH